MTFTRMTLLAALAVVPVTGHAQGFEGAELSAGILAYSDDRDMGETSYAAGLQFGITPGIAVGAAFAYHGFRAGDDDSTGFTLRGLYGLTPGVTLGLFAAQDRRAGEATDIYGIEAATDVGGIAVEGWLGRMDGAMGDGTLFNLAGSYAFGGPFAATAEFGVVNIDDSARRIALGGEYRFDGGPSVFAQIGQSDADGGDETFLSIGARIELGSGTTFGARGPNAILPGF